MERHSVPVGSGSRNYRLLPIKILLGFVRGDLILSSGRILPPTLPTSLFLSTDVFGHIGRF